VVDECKKGDSISTFLEKCRLQFSELRGVNVDNLMYVKVSSLLHWSNLADTVLGGFGHTPRKVKFTSEVAKRL